MSEAEQVGAVVTEDLRSRFLDLKKDLSGLYINVTRFTFAEVFEVGEYLSGKYDPTPTSSVAEVQRRIARLEILWMIGRPEGGHKS